MKRNLRQEMEQNGHLFRTNKGAGMEPMLAENDNLVDVVKSTGLLKPGDVALYVRDGGGNVMKRVIEVHDQEYVMCGDNETETELVPHEWVIGVVSRYYAGEDWVSVEDPKYLAYVHSLEVKRKKLQKRGNAQSIGAKLRNLFGGKKSE